MPLSLNKLRQPINIQTQNITGRTTIPSIIFPSFFLGMAPPCISRSFRCSSWPLLGHQAEVNCAEPAAHGYHDDGQPAHDGGSHFSRGTVESTAAPTPAWSVPWCPGGLAGQAASAGPRTGSCCCSCKSDISSSRKLGGHVPSNCLSAPRQLRYTVCRCPQTAPLHCLLIGMWPFYFQSCSQAPGFVRDWAGWGMTEGSRLEAWVKSHKSEVAVT